MLSLSAWPREGAASDDLAALAKRARSGAGLRVGTWQVQDLVDPPSGSSSVTPSVEGWFQKGLDLHLVLENTVGFWQRKESSTEPAGLGFETERENDTYLVPTMSALKFYPATRPSSPLEPYISAGVGPVLRIQRERVTSTDPLVLPTRATTIVTGLGITTGAGVDWNPGGPFGVRIGGHYQWASFGDNASGKRMYRGPGVNVGVTYSFRYQ
jgi:opacity protein-like surface antigen